MRFSTPTLITLTAPSCAGKSYLLTLLEQQLGCERVISTTDRPPRAGERDGVDYYFINTDFSARLEALGEFAELVTFNGTRYGVTHDEMRKRMAPGASTPVVVLEPNGLSVYRRYCADHGWKMLSIFVNTPEAERIARLTQRTAADIAQKASANMREWTPSYFMPLVHANNKRLTSILTEERTWFDSHTWDLVVPGNDSSKALELISSIGENMGTYDEFDQAVLDAFQRGLAEGIDHLIESGDVTWGNLAEGDEGLPASLDERLSAKIIDQGNEGDGNYAFSIVEYTLDGVSLGFVRYTGVYSSWDSSEWDSGYTIVVPRKVTAVEYIAADGSEDHKYLAVAE